MEAGNGTGDVESVECKKGACDIDKVEDSLDSTIIYGVVLEDVSPVEGGSERGFLKRCYKLKVSNSVSMCQRINTHMLTDRPRSLKKTLADPNFHDAWGPGLEIKRLGYVTYTCVALGPISEMANFAWPGIPCI